MEHLSALDAGFLEVEDADPHISMAIGGIAVLTGPAPDFDALIDLIADRITAEPRLRQVLRIRPWDLGAPEWVDDPAFDITHHVHRVAVPRPGDDAALHRLTADIMGHRLDRNRPLWESWVIEGLAQNRWAVLTKIHHCMADGVSAARMLGKLLEMLDWRKFFGKEHFLISKNRVLITSNVFPKYIVIRQHHERKKWSLK